MVFGEQLKDLRKRAGLTQVELVDALNAAYPALVWSQSKISTWEMRSDPPADEYLDALIDFFGVSKDYFEDEVNSGIQRAKAHLQFIRFVNRERIIHVLGGSENEYEPDDEHLDT